MVKMKKNKLSSQVEQHSNYVIYDLSTALPDFQIAYFLNKILDYKLVKEKDFQIYLPPKNQAEKHSLYYFKDDKLRDVFLISDLKSQMALMKSFFLIFQGVFTEEEKSILLQEVGNINQILNFNQIELSDIKPTKPAAKRKQAYISAILTDLEYHMIEVNRDKYRHSKLTRPKLSPE